MARILVLPGTAWQVALVQRAKDLGHNVYVVSPEKEPPCAKIADGFFCSDIFAVDAIVKYAVKNGIEAVVSDECDIAMPVVACLGKRMGLHTLSCEAAELYTNKYLMREFCTRNGLKRPEYQLCRNADEAVAFLRDIGRPIIIKPLDSNASHGVFKVETEEDVRGRFDESMSFSRNDSAILAERYIDGVEFTIDGLKTANAHYTLAISEKKHFKHNPNIANELFFSHNNLSFDYEKLKAENDAFVMASPLEYGFTHAEYKFEHGAFYLIEIGARGGGNMISSVIAQFMSGHDTYRYLIDSALNRPAESDFSIGETFKKKTAVLKFLETPNGGGIVKSISGLECIKKDPMIRAFHLNFDVGDRIDEAKNDSARIGFFIACAETKEQLDTVREKVDQTFRIEMLKQ
ncbi:MAG: ATP-grasp domain-containing protein [Clostridium lundense]|nr:ATP-grasp domain-containing protein [Clostridium lundense]